MSSSADLDKPYPATVRATISPAILTPAGNHGAFHNPHTASEVFPRLYVADVFTACTPDTLRALAITHVVSALDHPITFPTQLSLRILRVPIQDIITEDLLSHLPSAVEFIAAALQDPQARVLVHCWQGVSRSASIVVAYLIYVQHMTAQDAVTLIKSKRPIVQPNSAFLRQLRQYEALVRVQEPLTLEVSMR